jgi:hypothetical protein
VRLLSIAAVLLLAACGPPPAPVASTRADATQQLWYGEAVTQLAALDRQAEKLYQSGRSDEAAALVTKGESLATRILDVPRPTLAAMETVSDLDQLYGQMLLANRNYGWARLVFQKNRARWKTWKPATSETEHRLRLANSAIAECDRHLGE